MIRGNKTKTLSSQMKTRDKQPVKAKKALEGNISTMISTGSTLLDLAITGGRVRGGGIPGGILVEAFGPSSSGKTVLLCEIAGAIQRKGGKIMFDDPEARLNKQFARMFDLDTSTMDYATSDTVTQVFNRLKTWDVPSNPKIVNGMMTDSLAALSTDLEMDKEEGDKMGMRRAKEFSEGLRKTCRIVAKENYLMACSNQVRQNNDAAKYGPKFRSTGGEAIGFYASLRLRFNNPVKIYREIKFAGKPIKKAIGVTVEIEVFKSSVWKPYRTAPVTILFDYGIDDIRQNLQFIKNYTKNTTYTIGDTKLGTSMEAAIATVEEYDLEKELKEQVIDLWELIEEKFNSNRKTKKR